MPAKLVLTSTGEPNSDGDYTFNVTCSLRGESTIYVRSGSECLNVEQKPAAPRPVEESPAETPAEPEVKLPKWIDGTPPYNANREDMWLFCERHGISFDRKESVIKLRDRGIAWAKQRDDALKKAEALGG